MSPQHDPFHGLETPATRDRRVRRQKLFLWGTLVILTPTFWFVVVRLALNQLNP